ncbi:hypothetical protein [Calothrix sp. 336/3]|uniref:hypothetical protein n=1 Tax=Calothrix sp. 336/3 TaxID=1337936 RepID=UPI0004E2B251|nr:hypothetical protein [Calothrix sp. 336/3]AKG22256.1 hypothetical protein IJ00_14185 [Calothrix sp. 336/3]
MQKDIFDIFAREGKGQSKRLEWSKKDNYRDKGDTVKTVVEKLKVGKSCVLHCLFQHLAFRVDKRGDCIHCFVVTFPVPLIFPFFSPHKHRFSHRVADLVANDPFPG